MELNRVQLLVHDDAVLNKLRTDHGILANVKIEYPEPNENASLVEGHGDRILVCIWLIHQAGLRFPINPMLKEVMARCHLTFMQCDAFNSKSFGAELNANPPQTKVWEEGITSSSSSYTSSESSNGEKEEEEEAVSQLVVNRRRNRVPSLADPEAPIVPFSILSSENEHSNDLAFVPLQLARDIEIAHSFREGCDTNASSSEINMGGFRTLG
ncbi:hypothetical protein Acr_22g0005070 [Actinidia rufa]|uniref:Uncharacterized protein n=1 Tax=Actinidia rufa TaxID=165716 RepID=A0A7J0GJW4_9ERIC|nr:hypothetical protein Acr_22g0005070 [Actinidia rufa]